MGNLIQIFLPKQADIDKISKMIQRKVLKGTHLLVEIKEIQAGYLDSHHFKDMFLYLLQNKLPSSKAVIKKGRNIGREIHTMDSLLFKITPEKELAVLAVPESTLIKLQLYTTPVYLQDIRVS